MIDFAVIDLMHHMSTTPPIMGRPFAANVGVRANLEVGEEEIQKIESMTANWMKSAEAKFRTLIKEYRDTQVDDRRLVYLDQMIEAFEAQFYSDVRKDKKAHKIVRVTVKRQKSSPKRLAIVGLQGNRALRALAQVGELKQEIIFALRALRSELKGTSKAGPIFSDPSAMTAYLRAAVA